MHVQFLIEEWREARFKSLLDVAFDRLTGDENADEVWKAFRKGYQTLDDAADEAQQQAEKVATESA